MAPSKSGKDNKDYKENNDSKSVSKKKVKQDQQRASHEQLNMDQHKAAIEEKARSKAARAAAPSAAAVMDEDGSSSDSSTSPRSPPTRKPRTRRPSTPRTTPIDVDAASAPAASAEGVMEKMYKDMLGQFAQLNARFDHQDTKVDSLSSVVMAHGNSIQDISNKVSKQQNDTDAKIALLEAQVKEISAALAPASAAWSAPSGAGPAASAAGPRGSSSAASFSPAPSPFINNAVSLSGFDPTKLIVKGFHRSLMKEHFNLFYTRLCEGTANFLDDATAIIPNRIASVFFIKFPTKEATTRFLRHIPDIPSEFLIFHDPESGDARSIRIQRDQPLDVRNCTSRLSKLWKPAIDALTQAKRWTAEEYQVGDKMKKVWALVNQNKNLYIVEKGLPYALFQARVTGKDQISVFHDPEIARKFGIEDFAKASAPALS